VGAVIDAVAAALALLSALGAVVGAWFWWHVRPSRAFWVLARAAQATAVLLAAVSGLAAALGHRPDDGLFWIYALVPVVVGFLAEQLRIASASSILDARGLGSAQEVGKLPEAEQRSVVLAIVRREMGVMTLALIVTCFLALRALGTSGGI
jgi:hypothetical protein